MDLLQNQVTVLSQRVDALHQMLEQLSNKTSEVLSEVRLTSSTRPSTPSVPSNSGAYTHRSAVDPAMEHKDVLLDSIYADSESQNTERVISPEIQIQRLTAQLTAAYNRIAALEEQLLSQRIHH